MVPMGPIQNPRHPVFAAYGDEEQQRFQIPTPQKAARFGMTMRMDLAGNRLSVRENPLARPMRKAVD